MPDYSKGKIYTIRSHQTDDVYIGSTTQKLCERLRDHKKKHKYWKNGIGHNVSSYQILEYDDAYIELLEDYPCERRDELHKREGQLIREMNCVNKFIAGRSKEEYRKENKERQRVWHKVWCEKNRTKLLKDKKEYYEIHKERLNANRSRVCECECGSTYTHNHKARHLRTKKHQAYLKSLNKT